MLHRSLALADGTSPGSPPWARTRAQIARGVDARRTGMSPAQRQRRRNAGRLRPSTCRAGSRATSSAPPRSPNSGGRRRAGRRPPSAASRGRACSSRARAPRVSAKWTRSHHVVLGDDVLAFEQPGLADAELRRDVDDEAVLEARHVGAHEIDAARRCACGPRSRPASGPRPSAPSIAGHVRAVAPDDAGQRRLQPPVVPRAAHDALRLPVDLREGLRFLVARSARPRRCRRRRGGTRS